MKAGDKVAWMSQAQGYWKKKNGTVVENIPAEKSARRYIPASAKKSHIKFDADRSNFDRVLVAVPYGKNGQITHYYCPRKSVVVLIDSGE